MKMKPIQEKKYEGEMRFLFQRKIYTCIDGNETKLIATSDRAMEKSIVDCVIYSELMMRILLSLTATTCISLRPKAEGKISFNEIVTSK